MHVAKTIASLLAALPLVGVAAGSSALLDQLQADHAALLAAEQDFQRLREGGKLIGNAAADYRSYLETLRERVAADCRTLAEAGQAVVAGPVCGAFPSNPVQALPLDEHRPLTSVERTNALDAELAAGLSEFDELLLREQQRVKASAPRSARDSEAGGGAAGAEGEQAQGAGEQGEAAGAPDTGAAGQQAEPGEDAAGRAPGVGAGGQGAPDRAARRGQQPAGIPDGSDDDVVARQMREAAEQETDPELQKKLWEEYRRYKQGIR